MDKHEKRRLFCRFQYWLSTNYNTLPTNSIEMTKRSVKFLKENEDVSNDLDFTIKSIEEAISFIQSSSLKK